MGGMPDAIDADGLTVGQVSTRLGVTVRTLHHWDEIGLAPPSLRTYAGYRLYTADDLERLHRIVVYRELGLGLEPILYALCQWGQYHAEARGESGALLDCIVRPRETEAAAA